MPIDQAQVLSDFAAFADDEKDVLIESDGTLMYRRLGRDITCRIRENGEGAIFVSDDQGELPYRTYIGNRLGQLHVFAQKLLADRASDPFYVDGHARLESIASGDTQSASLVLLHNQCSELSPFASRVAFITADAGHGKTALLRQYQYETAVKYSKNRSQHIFWHVDLQGRQLVRLSEALMGDLGELRMTGLYMPSVLVLIRMRLLILAIDGFDELAAEQGTTDALGALRVLLDQMNGRGAIVAASRRTFFNTDSYTRRTKTVIQGAATRGCEFNEIRLLPWNRKECTEYLSKVKVDQVGFPNPESAYAEMETLLDTTSSNPILTTPFLFSHVAKGVLRYGTSVSEFISGMVDPVKGVPAVVKAFIKREVSDKWKSKDTGEPYLTVEQHMSLLSAIAEEMWNSQVDRLPTEVIETVTALLLDHWKIEQDRRRQIHEMVRMHVLLQRPLDAREDVRSFEHPEFQNYFVGRALDAYLKKIVEGNESQTHDIARFMSIGQMPDAIPKYASMHDYSSEAKTRIITSLCKLVESEWRPTHLQSNVGTILPFFLHGLISKNKTVIRGKILFSSVVFCNSHLSNITFDGGTFLQSPFSNVRWRDVRFQNCKFYEVSFDRDSLFENVVLADCEMEGISLVDHGNEVDRAYSRERSAQILSQCNVVIETPTEIAFPQPQSELSNLVIRLLRYFTRSKIISEGILRQRFSNKSHDVLAFVIPVMEKFGQIESVEWRGGGGQNAWQLTRHVDDILRDDNGLASSEGERFWQDVNSRYPKQGSD